MKRSEFSFYQFFAGGGMAEIGLGSRWKCLFSNDLCPKKASAYRLNFDQSTNYRIGDVAALNWRDLPGTPDLSWASFPCQDLSLAGQGQGLKGERSGTYWPYWDLMESMIEDGRRIPIIVLENVVGALSSHGGRDFKAIIASLVEAGYRVGAVVIDAAHFVPHSRKRLFVIATSLADEAISHLISPIPSEVWHPSTLQRVHAGLDDHLNRQWIWWRLPLPPRRRSTLTDLIEEKPLGVHWHSEEQTRNLLSLMSDLNRDKVEKVRKYQRKTVGTVYRRTRRNEGGERVQRAEVRFDQVSGCLRTPVGGSSRQTILLVEGETIRSRLLSAREAARLMGLPDTYKLPANYNEAYHLMGDGLVVPVVSFLGKQLLSPLASSSNVAKSNEKIKSAHHPLRASC